MQLGASGITQLLTPKKTPRKIERGEFITPSRLASSAFLLARKCNRLARTCIMNLRNATCVGTQTSKVPTQVTLLFIAYTVPIAHIGSDHGFVKIALTPTIKTFTTNP